MQKQSKEEKDLLGKSVIPDLINVLASFFLAAINFSPVNE